MESPIEKLVEKYWNGDTTVEEERQIKAHFKAHPELNKESDYFRFIKNQQHVTFESKAKRNKKRTWLSAAATVTVGLITAALVLQESTKDPFAVEDPQRALEETRKALMLIGSSLNEGQSYTLELTKINKAKDELSTNDER